MAKKSGQSVQEQIDALNKRINDAFPGGDEVSHKMYHEAIKEESQSRRELAREIKNKTLAGIVLAGVFWAVKELWSAAIAMAPHFGKGP